MVYGVIFTHLVALFPAEIIQLNRQYEGSIILDIQPKMKLYLSLQSFIYTILESKVYNHTRWYAHCTPGQFQ